MQRLAPAEVLRRRARLATRIGAIFASFGTFRSARRFRSALVTSCQSPTTRSASAIGPVVGVRPARGRCRRSRPAGPGAGSPRLGATCAERLPDLLGEERDDRVEQAAEAVEDVARTPWAIGRADGSRSRPLTNSTYQSQKSFQVKSRSRRVASANWNASRSAVTPAAAVASRLEDPAVLDRQVGSGRSGPRGRSPPGSSGRTARRSRTCWGRSGPARTGRRC